MADQLKSEELAILKTIAETLNQSNDLQAMLHTALEKLLQVTRLQTGWIFLTGSKPEYVYAADSQLPPGLALEDKKPMCSGTCWCLDQFWEGKINSAVNIIHCKRLEDAKKYRWGDTQGITHHATVPLLAGKQALGLLNVASPDKKQFTQDELALLQAVAYQIGTAVARTKLFQAEQRRAESFTKLGEATRLINMVGEADDIPEEAVKLAYQYWQWPVVAFFMKEEDALSLRAMDMNGVSMRKWATLNDEDAGWIGKVVTSKRTESFDSSELTISGIFPPYRSGVAVPMMQREALIGVMVINSGNKHAFDLNDIEVLEAFAGHAALACENTRLFIQRQELARWEERNRLARDLHDSVSQTLFSMALTSRGIEHLLPEASHDIRAAVQEISHLAQYASKEMRSLILQLRPAELEEGLISAFEKYGKSLGLIVSTSVKGPTTLPRRMEEALWRVGQEALNNIRKHAGVIQAFIQLVVSKHEVVLEISDLGRGIDLTAAADKENALGLSIMRERTEMLCGTFAIESRGGSGTKVTIEIPLPRSSV